MHSLPGRILIPLVFLVVKRRQAFLHWAAQHLARLAGGQFADIGQAARDGLAMLLGILNVVGRLTELFLRPAEQVGKPCKIRAHRAQQRGISPVRCSMASDRKPICRLVSSAASVVGPATTMWLSL